MSVPLRQMAYQSFGDLLIERSGIDEGQRDRLPPLSRH